MRKLRERCLCGSDGVYAAVPDGTNRHRRLTVSTCAIRKQISAVALASAETLNVRHAGCVLVLEAQHDGGRVSSGNLFCDRPEAGVGCCQRPFLVHRNADEKATLVVGICLLTTNELNARMRKRMAGFVDRPDQAAVPMGLAVRW